MVTSTYSSELGYRAWRGAKFSRPLQEQLGTKTDGIISGQPTANKKYFWAVDGGVAYGTSGSYAIEELRRRLKAAGYDPNGIDRRFGKGRIAVSPLKVFRAARRRGAALVHILRLTARELATNPPHLGGAPSRGEIYAVLNVLPALGVEASYDDVLTAMPDFQGDPDTVGWAWPEDVCEVINTFSPGSAHVDTGSSYDSLLEDGYAIIWITTDYSLQDGPVDDVWPDEHCVLMISDDGHGASVSDSLFGFTLVPTDTLREIWEDCESRCVKISRQ